MGIYKVLKAILCVVLSVSIAGCATMFNGSSQVMSIRSTMDDAKLYVNENYIGKGNGTETFQKKKQYTITARKEGCRDTNVIVTKSFDATTLLGILIDWGIISILIVDGAATGAWQHFDKTSYLIDPDCSNGKDAPLGQGIEVKTVQTQPAPASQPAQPATNFNGGSVNKK